MVCRKKSYDLFNTMMIICYSNLKANNPKLKDRTLGTNRGKKAAAEITTILPDSRPFSTLGYELIQY